MNLQGNNHQRRVPGEYDNRLLTRRKERIALLRRVSSGRTNFALKLGKSARKKEGGRDGSGRTNGPGAAGTTRGKGEKKGKHPSDRVVTHFGQLTGRRKKSSRGERKKGSTQHATNASKPQKRSTAGDARQSRVRGKVGDRRRVASVRLKRKKSRASFLL